MSKKKLITLAKEHDFETEQEYIDYILDSIINGQRAQAKNLISEMKKQDIKNTIVNFEDEIDDMYIKELIHLMLDSL